MADELLFGRGCLAEGSAKLVGAEVRIISEAARSARRFDDAAMDFATANDFVTGIDERRDTDVVRTPVGSAPQSLDEQPVVLVVKRLTVQVRASAPSLAQHSGR